MSIERIQTRHPTPWTLTADETIDPDEYIGGFEIRDARGDVVMDGGTYPGDGDMELNLDWKEAIELVELVNQAGRADR